MDLKSMAIIVISAGVVGVIGGVMWSYYRQKKRVDADFETWKNKGANEYDKAKKITKLAIKQNKKEAIRELLKEESITKFKDLERALQKASKKA